MKSNKTSNVSKRKRYSPSKRVAESEARSSAEAQKAASLRTSRTSNTLEKNYTLWLQTDTARQKALDLSDQASTDDEIILRAFNAHHLDWKNPFDWKRLLSSLASAHYGDRLRSGRKQKWTEAKLIELLNAVTDFRKSHPKLSESRICAKLIQDEPYRGFSAATLQKQLGYARSLMRDVISGELQKSVREEAQRRGVALTAEFEEKLLKRTRSAAARALSGLSPRGRKPKEFAI
jgi:hypothetical protein